MLLFNGDQTAKAEAILQAYLKYVDAAIEARRQLFKNWVAAYNYPHPSTLLMSGEINGAQQMARMYQTTQFTSMPIMVRYPLMKRELDKGDCVVITALHAVKSSLIDSHGYRSDQVYTYDEVIGQEHAINRATTKTIVIVDDPLYYEHPSAVNPVYHIFNEIFPTKDVNNTHIEVILIKDA